jgi:hypothetical protein
MTVMRRRSQPGLLPISWTDWVQTYIKPLRLQVTLPLHLAAVGADLPLLLQTHQGAQT